MYLKTRVSRELSVDSVRKGMWGNKAKGVQAAGN